MWNQVEQDETQEWSHTHCGHKDGEEMPGLAAYLPRRWDVPQHECCHGDQQQSSPFLLLGLVIHVFLTAGRHRRLSSEVSLKYYAFSALLLPWMLQLANPTPSALAQQIAFPCTLLFNCNLGIKGSCIHKEVVC